MYSVYHCIQKPTSPIILISSQSSAAKQGQYFQYFDSIYLSASIYYVRAFLNAYNQDSYSDPSPRLQ